MHHTFRHDVARVVVDWFYRQGLAGETFGDADDVADRIGAVLDAVADQQAKHGQQAWAFLVLQEREKLDAIMERACWN